MNLSNKKILVTGADGFIGSHLVEELVERGHDVKAFVLYNSNNSLGWLEHSSDKVKKSIQIFSGDIRDPNGVRTAMKDCHVVLNLAALIGIPYSYHSPDSYLETNVRGALNVVQAARDLNTEKIVQISTSEVYGTARFVPITEAHPLQGQSPYSATKIAADQMALSFFLSFQTPVAIARPFNTYGPRQSSRAVIPTIITQLAVGKKKIQLGSTEPTRDFNYVSDTVNGIIAIAESQASIGEVINIGSNYEISIGETAKLIAEVMGVSLDLDQDQNRIRPTKSEVERLWADNQKAKELAGWVPKYAGQEGLRRGLIKTIEWFQNKQNLGLYKTDVYNI